MLGTHVRQRKNALWKEKSEVLENSRLRLINACSAFSRLGKSSHVWLHATPGLRCSALAIISV